MGVDKQAFYIRIALVDGRKGWRPNKLSIRSRLSDPIRRSNPLDNQTRKNRRLCEEALGFGTAKAVVASGAVTVHASTLLDSLAGVGGWSVTNVAALPFCARLFQAGRAWPLLLFLV